MIDEGRTPTPAFTATSEATRLPGPLGVWSNLDHRSWDESVAFAAGADHVALIPLDHQGRQAHTPVLEAIVSR